MNIKQLRIIQSNFLHELQDAQDGKKTSLPFIVHEIPSSSLVKEGELFEVLVIGGSIWKKAILQKTKTGIGIIKKETERSVDFKNEKDFLEFIDNEAKDNIQVLALNFAYPLKPIFKNGRLDGKLLAVSKERSFHGLIGKKIGFEIEKYILEKRKKSREAGSRFARKIIVSLANDTICLLLAVFKQPGTDNYPYSFSISYPKRLRVIDGSDYFSGQLEGDTDISARFAQN